mgnify:CR=1 FL=1
MADLESQLLQALNEKECIADSGDFAKSQGVDHMAVVGVIRSLQASEMIVAEVGASAAAADTLNPGHRQATCQLLHRLARPKGWRGQGGCLMFTQPIQRCCVGNGHTD